MSNHISRPLTPAEEEKLNKAMLSAFSVDSLKMMLRFKLGKTLDHYVSPSEGLRNVVFKIVNIANQEGWLGDLVDGALASNPGNRELTAFVESVTTADSDLEPEDKQEGEKEEIKSDYTAEELRLMILGEHGLTLSEVKAICFVLDIEYDDFVGGRSERVIGIVQHLSNRGRLQSLVDALNKEFPHVIQLSG